MQNESEISALTSDSEFFVLDSDQSKALLGALIGEALETVKYLDEGPAAFTVQTLGRILHQTMLGFVSDLGKTPGEKTALAVDFTTGAMSAFHGFLEAQTRSKMH